MKINNMIIVMEKMDYCFNKINTEEQFKLNPLINREFLELGEDKYALRLSFKIESTETNPFPINLSLSMLGEFEIVDSNKETINQFLKIQAIQIMFPYVRSAITNICNAALINPLILPVLDVLAYFEKDEK